MKIKLQFNKQFEKDVKKLSVKQRVKIGDRLRLFEIDQYNRLLRNHALNGKYLGYRSMNISGDVRMIYKLIDEDTALFVKIGSHSELYG